MDKLKLLYSSKEEIPEAFVSLYEETDGQFNFIGVDGLKTEADIEKVKTAKQHEVDNRKEAERLLKELKQRFDGIDPDKARQVLKDAEEKNIKKIDPNADLDKIRLQKEFDTSQALLEVANNKITDFQLKQKQSIIKDKLVSTARELNFDPAFDEEIALRISQFDTSESGDVLSTDGKTPTEFLQPYAKKYGMPSNGTGGKSLTSPPANSLNTKAYADAKAKGDVKGMMLNAPPVKQ